MAAIQLTSNDALVGRTIAETAFLGEKVVIRFTDGTFVVLVDEGYYDGRDIGISNEPLDAYEKKEAGLISEEEYAAEQATRRAIEEQQQKAQRRLMWERLRMEFGDDD